MASTSGTTAAAGSLSVRRRPNILVTGTPATGKSTLCADIVKALGSGFRHVSVSDLVQEKGYHGGRDEVFDTLVLDDDGEDALLDDLEEQQAAGGLVVEFHSSELFPERWFDVVLVLRCGDTRVLYDRLAKRGYTAKKVEENATAEIMGVCSEEAREAFPSAAVVELPSVTPQDVASNTDRTVQWASQWIRDHPEGVPSGRMGTGSSSLSSSSSSSASASLSSSAALPAPAVSSSAPPAHAPPDTGGSPFAAAAAHLTRG